MNSLASLTPWLALSSGLYRSPPTPAHYRHSNFLFSDRDSLRGDFNIQFLSPFEVSFYFLKACTPLLHRCQFLWFCSRSWNIALSLCWSHEPTRIGKNHLAIDWIEPWRWSSPRIMPPLTRGLLIWDSRHIAWHCHLRIKKRNLILAPDNYFLPSQKFVDQRSTVWS